LAEIDGGGERITDKSSPQASGIRHPAIDVFTADHRSSPSEARPSGARALTGNAGTGGAGTGGAGEANRSSLLGLAGPVGVIGIEGRLRQAAEGGIKEADAGMTSLGLAPLGLAPLGLTPLGLATARAQFIGENLPNSVGTGEGIGGIEEGAAAALIQLCGLRRRGLPLCGLPLCGHWGRGGHATCGKATH
jgi:hypothetical protein